MIIGSVSRRYAKALMAIGTDTKKYEIFGKELEKFAGLLGNKELRDTLENPSIAMSKRKAILEALIKRLHPSKTMRHFVLLLMDRNRIGALPSIHREYQLLADMHAGRMRAKVTSAQKLDLAMVSRLKMTLEKKTGKKIILEQATDPDLIGGLVTQLGSVVFDGSIRTSLEQMRKNLLQGEG